MKIIYDGSEKRFIIGQHFNYNLNRFEDTSFIMRKWGNTLIEAQPRYGKSALSKDLLIKISKVRKVIIFDYAGEWQHNVVRYNSYAQYPDRMINLRVLRNFTFNIIEFTNKEDFASMGFDGIWASIVCDLLQETRNLHNGDIETITTILSELPVKGSMFKGFNNKYGTTLVGNINAGTKTAITTRWSIIRKFFFQGAGDNRNIYDFGHELKNNTHLIIDLSGSDNSFDVFMKRAYCGKILEQMYPEFQKSKPYICIEEARMLFPAWSGEISLSSNVQIYNVVTHAPKLGVAVLFIIQHENQIYTPILENIHSRITGRVQNPPAWLLKIYKNTRLEYNPELNIREFLYLDVTSDPNNPTYKKFRPVVPCCYIVSDR